MKQRLMNITLHFSRLRLPLAVAVACGGCVCLSGLLLTGCNASIRGPHATPESEAAHVRNGIAILKNIDAAQSSSPDPISIAAPPPPELGESTALASPTPPPAAKTVDPQPVSASPAAMLTLDEVLARLQNSATAKNAADPTLPDVSDEARLESLKAYASGRAKFLAGQLPQATTDLERAVALNPASPEALSQLAEIQAAGGRRAAATASYKRAVALGLRDARVEAFLGRELLRAKRFEEAAAQLISARASAAQTQEPMAEAVASADLSDALQNLGYVAAARDLLTQTLKGLPALPDGPLNPEEAELFRRRGELWLRVGDFSGRLGDQAAAAAAYESASLVAGADPRGLLPRRMHASMKAGRSAQAALMLIDDLRAVKGRAEVRHFAAIKYLSHHSSINNELASAIDQLADELRGEASPTQISHLVRAAAAAAEDPEAQTILAGHLSSQPDDADAFSTYLATFGPKHAARTEQAAKLAAAHPALNDLYAEQFILRGQGLAQAITWLGAHKAAPGATLFHASLLRRSGRPQAALKVLGAAPNHVDGWETAALIEAAANAGDWNRALSLAPPSTGGFPKAAAFVSLQRYADALAEIAPLSVKGEMNAGEGLNVPRELQQRRFGYRAASMNLFLAELALEADKVKDAEAFFVIANTADPFDERPYEALLNLYAPKAPLADETRLSTIARGLRDNIPNSRFAQSIAARDLINRSQFKQAFEQIAGMLDKDSEHPSTLRLLVVICERAFATEPALTAQGEAMIRERLKDRGESPTLTMALARLLATTGKGEEAETLLAAYIAQHPIAEVGRLRELLVRETLNDPTRAVALAKVRLTTAPRGIDSTIELAQLLASQDEFEAAAQSLSNGLPPGDRVPLTKEQSARLVAIASRLKAESFTAGLPARADAALTLYDMIASRGIEMPPAMHLNRVLLVCLAHASESDRLYNTIEAAAQNAPGDRDKLIARVAQILLSKPDPSDLLHFLGVFTNRTTPPNEAYAVEWFLMTVNKGDAEDFEHLVRTIADPLALLTTLADRESHISQPAEPAAQRAEIAYWLGIMVHTNGRDAIGESVYRLALEFKPDHPWVLNNLGYSLLERGVNFDESERMITAAFAALPGEASVIDSMGWLRYKQGQFEDRTGPDGAVTPGAVTLIERAVKINTNDAPTNSEQRDHYGDALWRVGKKTEAQREWKSALGMVRSSMMQRRAMAVGEDISSALKRFVKQERDITAKLDALASNKEPPVAPTHSEATAANNQTPTTP